MGFTPRAPSGSKVPDEGSVHAKEVGFPLATEFRGHLPGTWETHPSGWVDLNQGNALNYKESHGILPVSSVASVNLFIKNMH